MRRAALVGSETITLDHLADSLGGGATAAPAQKPPAGASLRHRVRDQVRAIEGDALMAALEQAKGNKAEAARLLGIDYKTYRTKLKMLAERQGAAANEPS
jgi:two-component system nitrogen regulation response regulator GlnG